MPTVGLERQKAASNNTVNAVISAQTPTEIDTAQEDATFILWKLASTTPPTFTVASSAANASTNLTTAVTDGFANVAVGDGVSGTGIAGGTTVAAKVSNTQLTLSANTTGTISAGTITFTPPAITPTVLAIKVNFVPSVKKATMNTKDTMDVSVTLFTYNGSLLGANGTDANASQLIPLITNAANGAQASVTLDMEAFYSAIRVPKS